MLFQLRCSKTFSTRNTNTIHLNDQDLQNTLPLLPSTKAKRSRVSAKPSQLTPLLPRPPSLVSSNGVGKYIEADAEVRSIMKFYLPATLVVAATFTHMALVSGLSCDSGCAACWKIGSPGIDTKILCPDNGNKKECGNSCPSGYNRLHCANWYRC